MKNNNRTHSANRKWGEARVNDRKARETKGEDKPRGEWHKKDDARQGAKPAWGNKGGKPAGKHGQKPYGTKSKFGDKAFKYSPRSSNAEAGYPSVKKDEPGAGSKWQKHQPVKKSNYRPKPEHIKTSPIPKWAGSDRKLDIPNLPKGIDPDFSTDNLENPAGMKLQQYIAHAGIASRRKAEDYIRQGRITVNGITITDVTARVNEKSDHVKVDGHLVKTEKKVYIVMNKPEGVITSVTDDKGRQTVVDLLADKIKQRIYPVGRLDFNTTGALILTNDGNFANLIMHPKFEIPKRYVAKIKGRIAPYAINRLKKGLKIVNEDETEGRFIQASDAGIYKRNDANDLVYITIKEGINHQVKRMLEAVGASVIRLKRENIGPVTCSRMEPGQWRYMMESEINYFYRGKK